MIIDLEKIDSAVFDTLQKHVIENLSNPVLTSKNFSTVSNEPTETELPMVFLRRISGVEMGYDLEATTINGGLFTYEVKVYSKNSQQEATRISNAVVNAMKSMSFWMTSFPVFAESKDFHEKVSRFQREFDEGDIL